MSNTPRINLSLVLHNHQPVGNFHGVFEQAYQDSYLPFLNIFEEYSDLKIGLHTSGPLAEWLDEHHGDYLDRVARLVEQGRIEVVGGPFYEPILAMLPTRDRIGQIRSYTTWLARRLGAHVRGMWMPERVWEQNMAKDLVEAGIEYTVLDDFHFKNAGLVEDQLTGYYLTEDEGRLLRVFPGSEPLRYYIPFQEPHVTIDYLRAIAHRQPGAVVVFGDDGEKFGTWPDTKQHVYTNGWLRRFFEALRSNAEWLHLVTPSEALDQNAPVGKVYLPDSSYREMTEWALPAPRLAEYESVKHELEHDPRWPRIAPFVRGGFWRNFKTKYREADEMYCRMMQVSQRLDQSHDLDPRLFALAQRELYRGQCNCSYWHGAFGGIYLPHLRNAIYNHLIAADNLLDQAEGKTTPWVEASSGDFDLDGRQEILLRNDRLAALVAPARGGQMYELDVRTICLNLLATMTRRFEAYHEKVAAGPSSGAEQVASIHERVIFKQAGLDKMLQVDRFPRKSLLDHFFDDSLTLEGIASARNEERGDFVEGAYTAQIRRNEGKVQIKLGRTGNAWGIPLTITKGITLSAGSDVLEVAYLIEGLPAGRTFHFGVELNFSGMPAGADDRYFLDGSGHRLGQLGTQLDLIAPASLGLTDEWLGLQARLEFGEDTHVWTFPVGTVSGSEAGFEMVHQSVAVVPHWYIRGDALGRWSTVFRLKLDTSLAESRMQPQAVEAVSVS